jgi:molecular chaperone GrpE
MSDINEKEKNSQPTEAVKEENIKPTADAEAPISPAPTDKPEEEAGTKNSMFQKHKDKKNEEQIVKLQKQVDELNEKLTAAVNDKYRAYADADNIKKRLHTEADNANKYRIQSFALDILPALDNLQRALDGKDESDPFIKGVKMVYDQLDSSLKKEGLTEIDCLNKPFDPNYQHAIMTEKVEGTEPNMVVEVLQKGYMLKDRLLRAALVKVSE